MLTAQQVGGAERILQVAICLFAQKGYEATSTREIVEAAGVTKPMLYYYFGSKEGLCKAAIKRFVQPFFAELRQTTAESREPRELLVDFVWMHFQHFHNHRDVFQFYMSLCFGPDREKFLQDFESLGEEIHVLFGELASRVAPRGSCVRGVKRISPSPCNTRSKRRTWPAFRADRAHAAIGPENSRQPPGRLRSEVALWN